MLGVVKKGEVGIAVGTDKEWTEKREVDTQKPFHKGQRQITIMKARKPFFPGLSSAPLSEKESTQTNNQTPNQIEHHQTQHQTTSIMKLLNTVNHALFQDAFQLVLQRLASGAETRRRQFSLLTNTSTAFLVRIALICVPFVPIQADEGIIDHYC